MAVRNLTRISYACSNTSYTRWAYVAMLPVDTKDFPVISPRFMPSRSNAFRHGRKNTDSALTIESNSRLPQHYSKCAGYLLIDQSGDEGLLEGFLPISAVLVASISNTCVFYVQIIFEPDLKLIRVLFAKHSPKLFQCESQTYYDECVCVCCVLSSHSLWTSSSLDVPAGVTQKERVTQDFSSTFLLRCVLR